MQTCFAWQKHWKESRQERNKNKKEYNIVDFKLTNRQSILFLSSSINILGQQIVEEILDSQRPGCPIEYFNIPVPKDHPFLQGKESLEMPFPRTRYDSRTGYSPNNPRQQVWH